MAELTKEWLKQQISVIEAVGITDSNTLSAFKLALAALNGMEQEPVADVVAWHHPTEERTCDIRLRRHDLAPGPLYAAPQLPQPASDALERLRSIVADPRALPRRKEWISGQQYSYVLLENVEAMVDDACRAAMLQVAEPASQPYKLPDGMVIVPVEPTREMRLQIHPIAEATCMDCGRSVTVDCEDNVLLSWADMLAAAPQQEVRHG